jgi:hypothetical protein
MATEIIEEKIALHRYEGIDYGLAILEVILTQT